ncbi:MAG: ABC transporter permease [Chloroflexi bacterium]|nr:ABC transporter permease [Chloroflexota bacterium]MCI0800354.1 ABC transporter permease [Chloroflexota bacterium]MCI0810088.1 ABC transporter permease [Chloroflexota bacterium]MCI0828908.1 ABC transporter permease [Chloroflexota bacterium]MCI0846896.1 ABC transporter permease [Chloroflexota bacterium]
MRTAQAVAWKEIQIYFSSPTAYIVGLIFLALTGFFFTQDLGDPFPEATLTPFFDGAIIVFILLAPALTMRLLAEEAKLGTIELLLTAPVRDWEIIVGKYVASLVFFLVLVALSFFYAILLFIFASPDPGPIYAGYLGFILYGSAALSVGLLTSTMSNNQIVSAVVAMGILLAMFFADRAFGAVGGLPGEIIGEMGLRGHFDDFSRGVIDTTNIVYFVSVIVFFLFLSIRTLESRRWR